MLPVQVNLGVDVSLIGKPVRLPVYAPHTYADIKHSNKVICKSLGNLYVNPHFRSIKYFMIIVS